MQPKVAFALNLVVRIVSLIVGVMVYWGVFHAIAQPDRYADFSRSPLGWVGWEFDLPILIMLFRTAAALRPGLMLAVIWIAYVATAWYAWTFYQCQGLECGYQVVFILMPLWAGALFSLCLGGWGVVRLRPGTEEQA